MQCLLYKPAEVGLQKDQCTVDEVSQIVEQLCVVSNSQLFPAEHSILYHRKKFNLISGQSSLHFHLHITTQKDGLTHDK